MIPAEGAWEPDGSRERGGESGIRTHDEVAPTPVLKSCYSHQYPAPGLPEDPDDDRSYLRLLDDCIG